MILQYNHPIRIILMHQLLVLIKHLVLLQHREYNIILVLLLRIKQPHLALQYYTQSTETSCGSTHHFTLV